MCSAGKDAQCQPGHMKIKKIWHILEFYQFSIVIKSIWSQISKIPKVKIWIPGKNVLHPSKIVPGQNRFYTGLSQNTTKIKTFFGYVVPVSYIMGAGEAYSLTLVRL